MSYPSRIRILKPAPLALDVGPAKIVIDVHWVSLGGNFGYIEAGFIAVSGQSAAFVMSGMFGERALLLAAWREGFSPPQKGGATKIVSALLAQGLAEAC